MLTDKILLKKYGAGSEGNSDTIRRDLTPILQFGNKSEATRQSGAELMVSAHQMPGVDGHSIQSILSISDRALLRRFSSPEHVDRYSGALKGDDGSVMVQNELDGLMPDEGSADGSRVQGAGSFTETVVPANPVSVSATATSPLVPTCMPSPTTGLHDSIANVVQCGTLH